MNMIVCDKACKHQQDGYCCLNQITSLTGDTTAKCGYFENASPTVPYSQGSVSALPKQPEGL